MLVGQRVHSVEGDGGGPDSGGEQPAVAADPQHRDGLRAGSDLEFKIIENVSNALPPTDGTPGTNPCAANQFLDTPPGPPAQAPNYLTHNLRASAPGAVCLVLDNGQGNDLHLVSGTTAGR